MPLTLHNLGNKSRRKKRIGRGNASGHGTYSCRGLKGQRSRSGGKGGLKLKGFKKTLLGIPKFKGIKSIRPNNQIIKLSDLEKAFETGAQITPGTLQEKGLIDKMELPVKILLDTKEVKKKFEIFGIKLSDSARTLLEKSGSTIVEVAPEEKNKKAQEDEKKV